jgi:hypothetical protein|tara:strand:- start:790 stop:975 length:186 start_codon:yes stop_codon:yes gene_type:complete
MRQAAYPLLHRATQQTQQSNAPCLPLGKGLGGSKLRVLAENSPFSFCGGRSSAAEAKLLAG